MSDSLAAAGAAPGLRLGAEARDWFSLLKPRVVSLVVFTGAAGMMIAPGGINILVGCIAVLCIAVAAGAAGAINMWYDRDIDRLMQRTAGRAVAAGRIAPNDALGFGVVLSVAAVLLMWLATNAVAAILLAASIAFYVLIYTMWLKRLTPQNIVIGGAAGAFPPLIGWAAVTGSVGALPLILFAIVFFWTPPHFWALSLYACKDYARAGVPMLPVTHGAAHTRRQIMFYTVLLVGVSLLPVGLRLTGAVYAAVALAMGAGFVCCAWRVLRDRQDASGVSLTNDRPARLTFRFSLIYLAALFLAVIFDRLI